MKRIEEPRVGAFAACPFCGERKRLTLVTKRMRRGGEHLVVRMTGVNHMIWRRLVKERKLQDIDWANGRK